jgi:ArsR family transcriptional regulator
MNDPAHTESDHTDDTEAGRNDAPAVLGDNEKRDMVTIFGLLADKTRFDVLLLLQEGGELHVTALCERLGQSQPAVSHHLSLMRIGGLIENRREGKHNYYSVARRFASRITALLKVMSDTGDGGR